MFSIVSNSTELARKLLSTEARATLAQESSMVLRDGMRLFFRVWRPIAVLGESGKSSKAVFLFHRGHEHSGRLQESVEDLNFQDRWVFAWDARGHGKTGGKLESFEQLVDDADQFISFVAQRYNIDLGASAVVSHSFSSVALGSWIQKYKPCIAAHVMLAPAFKINLFVPFSYPLLKFWVSIFPEAQVRSFVSGRVLTRNREEARCYDNDETITRDISVNTLLGLREASCSLIAGANEISVPTLLLISGSDFIVDRSEQMRFFEALPQKDESNEFKVFPGMRHDIFHEIGRGEALSLIRSFVLEKSEALR